uniref:CSON007980 protein n=1 Tax=Culicoides sonorensis TaxID=179676 RepID=A0A336KFB7_CULSO
MKQLWTFLSTLAAICINTVKLQEETGRTLYSARYDNLDIDTILSSNRLVTNYVDCLLNKKPCPPEGKDLKRILPEALRTKCGRCSNKQKENAIKVIRKLYENYPSHYNALREKWDKSGEYHRRFVEYLNEEQFNQIGGNDNYDNDQSQINTQSVSINAVPSTVRPRPTTTTTTRRPTTTTTTTRRTTTTQRQTTTSTRARPPSISTTLSRIITTTGRPTRSPAIEQPNVSNNNNNINNNDNVANNNSPSKNSVFEIDDNNSNFTPQTEPQTPVTDSRPSVATNTFISNRFGDEDANDDDVKLNQSPPATAKPVRTYPPASETTPKPALPVFRPKPSTAQPSQSTSEPPKRVLFPNHHIINSFFVPPNQQGTQGPIAGIINAIGTKVTRTTEAIVGMIHNTARIITGQHTPPNYVN